MAPVHLLDDAVVEGLGALPQLRGEAVHGGVVVVHHAEEGGEEDLQVLGGELANVERHVAAEDHHRLLLGGRG